MFGEVFLIQRIMLHLKARQVGIAQALDVVDDGLHMVGLRSFGVELGLSKRSDAALFPDFALRDDRRTHRTFEKVGWTDVCMGQRIDKGGFARLNGSHHNHHKRLAMYLLSAVQQQVHLSVKFRIPLQIRIFCNRLESVTNPRCCLFEQFQACILIVCHCYGMLSGFLYCMLLFRCVIVLNYDHNRV